MLTFVALEWIEIYELFIQFSRDFQTISVTDFRPTSFTAWHGIMTNVREVLCAY